MLRISIDTNTLIDEHLNIRPGAVEAVQRLAKAGHEITYYMQQRTDAAALMLRFPAGLIVYYHDALHKLVKLYDYEESNGSAILIDAQWEALIETYQQLASGGYADQVERWREITAYVFGYVRLFAFGGSEAPLNGPLPAIAHIASWEQAQGALAIFERRE